MRRLPPLGLALALSACAADATPPTATHDVAGGGGPDAPPADVSASDPGESLAADTSAAVTLALASVDPEPGVVAAPLTELRLTFVGGLDGYATGVGLEVSGRQLREGVDFYRDARTAGALRLVLAAPTDDLALTLEPVDAAGLRGPAVTLAWRSSVTPGALDLAPVTPPEPKPPDGGDPTPTPPEPRLTWHAPTSGAIIGPGESLELAVSDAIGPVVVMLAPGSGAAPLELARMATPPWALELPADAPDGPAALVATTASPSGGAPIAASLPVVIDATPPALTPSLAPWVGPRLVAVAVAEDLGAGLGGWGIRDAVGARIAAAAYLRPIARAELWLDLANHPSGPLEFGIDVHDAVGLVSSLAVATTLDADPPTAVWAGPSGLVDAVPALAFTLADRGAGVDVAACELAVSRDGVPVEVERVATASGLELAPRDAADLRGGHWTFALTPRDRVANVGATASEALVIDLAAPTIASAGAAIGWVADAVASVSVLVDDDTGVSAVEVAVVDARGRTVATTLASPPWIAHLDVAGLDAPLEARVVARDAAQRSTELRGAIAPDLEPPTLVVGAVPPLVGARFEVPVEVSDVGTGVARVEVSRDGVIVAAADIPPTATTAATLSLPIVATSAGACPLEVRAVDHAGLATIAEVATTIDLDAPTVAFAPSGATVVPGSTRVVIRLDDPVGGPDLAASAATVRALVGDKVLAPSVAVVDGAIAVDFAAARGEGTLRLSIEPRDALGNVGSRAELQLPIDTRPPGLVSFGPGIGLMEAQPLSPVVFTFDEPVSLVGGQLVVTVLGVPALGLTSIVGRVVTFTPAAAWPPLANVQATLTGIRDLVGNVAGTLTFGFRSRAYAFIDVAARSPGLDAYRGKTGEPGENHGPGGTFADLDGDAFPELVLGPAPNEPLVVWRNVPTGTPPGRSFVPIQVRAGVARGSTGVAVADVDNDGDRDLFVGVWHGNDELWKCRVAETGSFTFYDATAATAPSDQPGIASSLDGDSVLDLTMSAAFADVDRDGLVDLYVAHHDGHFRSPQISSKPGQRATLYHQEADGTFRDITDAARVGGWETSDGRVETSDQRYASVDAVIFADLDEDRWPDLIVTNKTRTLDNRQMVYRNKGVGPDGLWRGFEPITYALGPTFGDDDQLAMGIDGNDLDNDGDLDFYITDWAPFGTVPGPNDPWRNLFAQRGNIGFDTDLPWARGVYSWGVQLQDFDNDGHVDIHVATNDGELDLLYMANRPQVAGAKEGYADLAASADVRQGANSRGDMSADLDQDGWVDLAVVNLDQPPRVYWNRWASSVTGGHHWITVALTGDPTRPGPYRSTRDALGARVIVHADIDGDGTIELLAREVRAGSSNAVSTSSLELEAGLGVATTVDLEIRWPSGIDTWLYGVAVDQRVAVIEPPAP